MQTINVLLAGDRYHPEFRQAIDWLNRSTTLTFCESVASACVHVAAGQSMYDLIIVAESRPGLYRISEIEKLRRLVPLARFIGLLGSWCEGETLSGKPWPGMFRSYWHQWPARFAKSMVDINREKCPHWGIPVTSTIDEQVLRQNQISRKQHGRLVVIHSDEEETASAVRDACRQTHYATVSCVHDTSLHVSGAVVVIWDQAQLSADNLHELRQLVQKYAPAPVLALLSFPRIHVIDEILDMGVQSVISKPFLLSDLYWELERIVPQSELSSIRCVA